MESELRNSATSAGIYNNIPTSITSTVSVVTIIDGLSITKTADKQVWADGILTYTIIVDNQTEKVYGKYLVFIIYILLVITYKLIFIMIPNIKTF